MQRLGKTLEAMEIAREALKLVPDDPTLKYSSSLMLPLLYEHPAELDFYRQRFTQNLDRLISEISLETPEEKRVALGLLGTSTNFDLAYQGSNDLPLQVGYGQMAHRIMATHYPQWAVPRLMPALESGEKIRVGYMSAFFHHHAVANTTLGWLRHADKRRFEVYCYHIGNTSDYVTAQFRRYSDRFHHLPDDLEAACKQIVGDQLHVLVFPDIGMCPQSTQMAALRLAPVQCVSWGHPVTSGIPTVDYYLSGDLMEPVCAQEHYSEQLIRLPNIGVAYDKPETPSQRKGRETFGIRPSAVVYLSCQSLFKYLPRYDYIFPEIAGRVPDAQFIFLSHEYVEITAQFRRRLERAFAQYGLSSEDFCIFGPRLNYIDYMGLNLVSDIYLDTLGWSGCNTTLEAIACGLPVVTTPGEFMRGRHSYAILKMLGITETIADSEANYIKIAVELGRRPRWRTALAQQIIDSHHKLYEDKTCVIALEQFYQKVIHERSDDSPST